MSRDGTEIFAPVLFCCLEATEMTLLREIQASATESNVGIGNLLRKAKMLAARLQNPEFTQWVDRELNGYPDADSLPVYRIVKVVVRGNLASAGGYRRFDGAPIMTTFLPDELARRFGNPAYLTGPIAEYAALLEGDSEREIGSPWPQEIAVKYGSKGYNEMECLGAWQVMGRNQLVSMIEAVRNRLQDFAIQIEATNPDAGEASLDTPPMPQERVTQVFNTVIMGGVNNVATGNTNVSQSNSGQVTPGDLKSLLIALRGAGVSEDAVGELEQTLKTSPEPKEAARSWIEKLALSGAQAATSAVLGEAVKVIAAHFGLS
jgi:hypothetical protein